MRSEKGYISVGTEVEDEVMPDEATFLLLSSGRFDIRI